MIAYQEGKRPSEEAHIRAILEWEQVATPRFTPNGGTFLSATDVSISTDTADAIVLYSISGNPADEPRCDTPTRFANAPTQHGLRYNGTITIGASSRPTNLQAIACKVLQSLSGQCRVLCSFLSPLVLQI